MRYYNNETHGIKYSMDMKVKNDAIIPFKYYIDKCIMGIFCVILWEITFNTNR